MEQQGLLSLVFTYSILAPKPDVLVHLICFSYLFVKGLVNILKIIQNSLSMDSLFVSHEYLFLMVIVPLNVLITLCVLFSRQIHIVI